VPRAEAADFGAGCARAARLAGAGEHKPAVDALESLLAEGADCEPSVLDAVAVSERTLTAADALVRQGIAARRAGDIETARRSFRQARDVYPKYFWVERLEKDLPPDPSARVAALRQQAAELLVSGQPEEALRRLEEAAELTPPDPGMRREIARLRTDLGDERLGEAHEAQQAGDLTRAVELTEMAIAARPDSPVRDRVIEFARRLGLNLFSAGELVQAKAIWQAAITLDQGNELLRQYLDEVDSRLRSLDRIKQGNGG
jgi:tetratricopeptide (TPR) repeat protein